MLFGQVMMMTDNDFKDEETIPSSLLVVTFLSFASFVKYLGRAMWIVSSHRLTNYLNNRNEFNR